VAGRVDAGAGGRMLGDPEGRAVAGGGSKSRGWLGVGADLVGAIPSTAGFAGAGGAGGGGGAIGAGLDLLDHQSGILRAPACFGTLSVLLSISSKRAAASLRLLVAMDAPRRGTPASCLRTTRGRGGGDKNRVHCTSLRHFGQLARKNGPQAVSVGDGKRLRRFGGAIGLLAGGERVGNEIE
jgi:hypothetical protein